MTRSPGAPLPDGRSGVATAATAPTFREALGFWAKLGFINFGGPAGQIAILQREVVDRRQWVDRQAFGRSLDLCMLLPGPEAQQLATYLGWRLHGIRGGLAAGLLFILPSVFVLLALAWLVADHGDVPAVAGLLYGVQPVVVAIVLDAVVRLGRDRVRSAAALGLAVAAFVATFALSIPFPLVVIAAGAIGLVLRLSGAHQHAVPGGTEGRAAPSEAPGRFHGRRAGILLAVFGALWAIPLGLLVALRGAGDVLVREFLFFTQAALVTFGGAYAVLAYVAEVAVETYGWLTPDEMVQGLALAESTPGPLIMVTQYVGFLGAWNLSGGSSPLLNGTLGGLVSTYATFLPSFLLVFLLAPYVDRITGERRLQAALAGVAAAVVGVIGTLGAVFAARTLLPAERLDLVALAIALVTFALIRGRGVPVFLLVPLGAVAGLVLVATGLR